MTDRPLRVLVADDEADLRALVEVAVRRAGMEAVLVADGDAVLAAVAAERPDAVVLDVSMPGTGGIEVCARLRADPATADLPIMLLSAAVHEAAVQAGADAGADAYVGKPFGVRDLAERLRVLVATRAAGGGGDD